MNTPTSRQTAHEKNLSDLIDTILLRIEQEVVAVIPCEVSSEVRKAILEELLPNARFGLEGLGIEQLQNERAIDQHIANTVSTAQYLVERILKTDPTSKVTESICVDCDGTGAFDLFDDLPCESCGGTGTAPGASKSE
jgi:hypothetical protein